MASGSSTGVARGKPRIIADSPKNAITPELRLFRREGIPIMTAEMAQIMQKTRFFLLAGGILLSLAALRSEADWPVQFEIDASVRRPI